jgi:predicted nucleic acid-binding protein
MRATSGLRRYWDSCNFISLIAEDEADRAEICQHILEDAEAGRLVIITSTLTIAEVIRMRWKANAHGG